MITVTPNGTSYSGVMTAAEPVPATVIPFDRNRLEKTRSLALSLRRYDGKRFLWTLSGPEVTEHGLLSQDLETCGWEKSTTGYGWEMR